MINSKLSSPLNPQPLSSGINNTQYVNNRNNRSHYFAKLIQTTCLSPFTTGATLVYRTTKLLSWDLLKTGFNQISGYYTESSTYFEKEYLQTVKALRDLLFIPAIAMRAYEDINVTPENFTDDIKPVSTQEYLKVQHTKSFQQFSSYLHGCKTFEVISPQNITEFAATSDAALKTIMASHLFKPDLLAINFGCPNVATFITEEREDGSVETVKVDAKSLYREPMVFHPTHGKIQSGVFLVPTNLQKEALERFRLAAEKLKGRKDVTCVKTNCRVLKEAGFSIEGVEMDRIMFPKTFFEHLLFRNLVYTDLQGNRRKVHFDIINTTQRNLEEYFEEVDTAVVGTRLRHRRRNADTEENKRIRGAAAQAMIDQETQRLASIGAPERVNDEYLGQRKVTVSVPSFLGDTIARIWGRHTMYEVDLADKREQISDAFQNLVANEGGKAVKLRSFPQEKPNMITRLKRDFFFSAPVIRFLRRHMMGRVDTIYLHTQDIFKHLKSTKGARLNYVLLDDRMVLAKTQPNENSSEAYKKAADWALSKHALLSGLEEVYCAGEIWYDETKNRFILNDDSGTYKPSPERTKIVAELANNFFDAKHFDNVFEAASEEVPRPV